MRGPSLAMHGQQLLRWRQRTTAPVERRHRDEETDGPHEGEHRIAAPTAAESEFETEVFHRTRGQAGIAGSRSAVMQIERDVREQRPGAIAHECVENTIVAIELDVTASSLAHRNLKLRMAAQGGHGLGRWEQRRVDHS